MADKLKFAFYWAASCGGCEVAVLDIDEKILDVAEIADIVFWPVALDFKVKDVEAMDDGSIDVCFFNGAIRNSEQEHIAKLLRQKSGALVAFGACAVLGGIPGLANFHHRKSIFDRVYSETESTVNPDGKRPKTTFAVAEGDLYLPEFYNTVVRLEDVVEVDYYMPGCPPTPEMILEAVTAIAEGKLPPKGATFGNIKTVCDTCQRKKEEKKVKGFKRIHEAVDVDPEKCFLEQGIICAGSVTRDGCGARCLDANMPCRGCFGPADDVVDQGAQLVSTIATLLETDDLKEIEEAMAALPDLAGYAYRFSLPDSLLRRTVVDELEESKGGPTGGPAGGPKKGPDDDDRGGGKKGVAAE